ncbi:hypothetical protein P154DRAFT_193065 [Amniculicola lignicola CBS 123094]|uniref:Uncharacterized protein n=1 Tax=Amniculicola lignicola CBS 123094 TaxID=1392246 RepID=A0A6A5WID6_9PLEO|nr:hypothetical protein P154DRAFT_193065 [Amniculicola lignicola CBS 123094]
MSVESAFRLKHTNVSRPRLSHSDSQQSITASEGYYSVSGESSSGGDEQNPFRTPPSRIRSPQQSHEHLAQPTDTITPSLKGVGIPRQPIHLQAQSPTVSTIAEERSRPQTRELLDPRAKEMDSESLNTTPGMDDTPYIRFAIDQLTRDEEVRGSRLYPRLDEDYPVDRVIADDGLGYMDQEQERERRMSRHLPPVPTKHTPAPSADGPAVSRDVFVFRPASSLPQGTLHFLPAILRPLWLIFYILLLAAMLAALIFSAVYSNRSNGHGLWGYRTFGDNRYFVFEYLPTLLGMILLLWLFQIQVALQRMVPFLSMASESPLQRSEAVFLQLYPMQFLLPKLEYFRAGQPLIGVCFVVFWVFGWTIPLLASSFNVRYDIDERVWRWIAVQGILWTVIVLYIFLIVALLALMVLIMRKQTGLKWDPRSLADIIALLERSNTMGEYKDSETFAMPQEFKANVGHRTDRIGYWSTTKRPTDVFHGIGEEGGSTRRYSIEAGRIREKGPERVYPDDPTIQESTSQRPGDFSIRMDIRSPTIRLRYLPWYLRDSSVVAAIVTGVVLIIAFYVVSYVNSAVRLGFLPQVAARTNSAGFSVSNFVYSFIPSVIGYILFLTMLSYDYSLRTLRPYISLCSAGGATAEASLLLDYSSRLPISTTLSAIENRHFQTALLSFVSLTSATLPILAGGCFWTQYYPNTSLVRVAADLPGYYALCFFLALYLVGLFALLPGRRRAALPHRSTTLAEIVSWVYQSPILTDRAFSRPSTKSQLVTRLMGTAYSERTWASSLTSLVRPSRDNLRSNEPKGKGKARLSDEEKADANRLSVTAPEKIRYGFGIHVGRDGLEHLGIERTRRGGERSGRELVIWEEQKRARGRGDDV